MCCTLSDKIVAGFSARRRMIAVLHSFSRICSPVFAGSCHGERRVNGLAMAAALALAFSLAGCGGSGGSGGSAETGAAPPQTNNAPSASFTATPHGGPPPLTVRFDASASSDSDGSIASYEWDFGAGASGAGQMAEHTYTQSGAHQVRLTVTDGQGASATVSEEVVVNVLPAARVMADPVNGVAPVTVSFDASASADSDGEIVSFDWDFAGLAEASGMVAEHTFTEPGVHPVRLTVTDDLGGVNSTVFELNAEDHSGVAFTVPYVTNGRYAADLRPCTYNGAGGDCSLERLPFLGAEFSEPSVEDVMTRVLVSHRWMGDNFRAILERLPADVRLLARSVTAIVIASDIRPAYYWGDTGAIYLDADFFWLTPQQNSVVSMEADFRSDFGNQLQVELPWRYVRNNQWWGFALTPDGSQRLEDLSQVTAYLLYHELTHAADFMPVSRIAALDPRKTAPDAIYEDAAAWHSSGLYQAHPLRSQVMEDLGRVFFSGRQPTSRQIAIQPDDLIEEFSADGAVDFYSYTSQFEDLADLHETLLMSYHHGLEKDTAITSMRTEDAPDRIVAWGQRGRMTDLAAIERMRWTIDAMYPGNTHELHSYLTGRPAPLPMRRGDTWVNNIVLEGGGDFSSGGSAATPPGGSDFSSGGSAATPPGAVYQPPMFPHGGGAASQPRAFPEAGGTVTPSGLPESEAGASSSPTLAGCIRVTENTPQVLLERLGLD